jgi:hypothetical protein
METLMRSVDAWALTLGVHTSGGFRYQGVFGDKRLFFVALEDRRLTLDQVSGFAAPFHCGLLVPEPLEREADLSGLFAALVGCGCRGIAIYGPDAARLEDQFNRVVCNTFHQGLNGGDIWSTAHDRLSEAVAVLEPSGGPCNVYLIELGSPTLEERCFDLVRRWG